IAVSGWRLPSGPSGTLAPRRLQLAKEPGLGHRRVALDRGGRDAERLRRLFHRETHEIAELDDPHLLAVDALQAAPRLLEGQQVEGAGLAGASRQGQGDAD